MRVNDLFIGPKTHTLGPLFHPQRQGGRSAVLQRRDCLHGHGSDGLAEKFADRGRSHRQCRRQSSKKEPRQPGIYERAVTGFNWESDYLYFTVREPFPTRTTRASLVFGRVTPETPLILESQMAENGVIFSDGIEKDFLEFNSGTKAVIGIAEKKGVLVE